MIKILYGNQRQQFPDLFDQMHRLRKSVFYDRLKWDVPIDGDWEIDQFDTASTLYVLALDQHGQVTGSFRLMPTVGPNMLRDVFYKITENCNFVESPSIWESSRFCARASNNQDQREMSSINRTSVELIVAMSEVGYNLHLENIVTVYDAFLRRVLRQIGCNEILVGKPTLFGKVMTYAGMFTHDPVWLADLKRTWNLPDQLVNDPVVQSLSVAA